MERGEFFTYNVACIAAIAEQIEEQIEKQGKKKPERVLQFYSEALLKNSPNLAFYPKFEPEVLAHLQKGYKALKQAEFYAKNIDRFLAGSVTSEGFKDIMFDVWFSMNETDIKIQVAESGADREMDFDWEKTINEVYEKYIKS